MEITAALNLQSNTSCVIDTIETSLVKYNLVYNIIDLKTTANINVESRVEVILEADSKPINQLSSLYNLYDSKLEMNINLTSSLKTSLDKVKKPANITTAYYNIYSLEINFEVSIKSRTEIFVKSSTKPIIKTSGNYVLYSSMVTADISIRSNNIINLLSSPKPEAFTTAKYKLYDVRISAEIDIHDSVSIATGRIDRQRRITSARYQLEDEPGYIRIAINSKPQTDLIITYLSNNESIMVLDPELNLLTYLDDIKYFSWIRRWRRADSFKLKMNRYKDNAKYLKVNNYLVKKTGDVMRGGRIRERQIKVNENGRSSEVWEIKGRGFGNIFNSRVALHNINIEDGFDTLEASAEKVMKYYVDVNAVNPNDNKRKIPNLRIEENKGLGKIIKYKARFQKLSDILYDISKVTGLGWDIKFDLKNKEFIFQVLYAELKPEIKLSTNTDSVQKIKFAEDHLNSINTAVVAGQGEGSNRMVVKVTEDDL
ncbi:MAG TPA: hypothetical protein VKN64_10900 [Halanaerobiales bacterium]|nr:hypothetical protein [Halanaerobiales bacterium]